jgi:hypothetical protein
LLKAADEMKSNDNLIEFLPYIMKLLLLFEDTEIQTKCTLCIRAYIIHKPAEIQKAGLLVDINKLILHLLQPTTVESIGKYVGNLMILTAHIVSIFVVST